LPKVEPLIQEFKDERDAAFATSRISLGPMIARMRDVFKKTNVLEEWPEPVFGYALREKLRAAEEYEIETIVEFQEQRLIRRGPEPWQDANRQLARLKDIVAATKR
jgi:hypothetical protein